MSKTKQTALMKYILKDTSKPTNMSPERQTSQIGNSVLSQKSFLQNTMQSRITQAAKKSNEKPGHLRGGREGSGRSKSFGS
jgi:hypothetical protein